MRISLLRYDNAAFERNDNYVFVMNMLSCIPSRLDITVLYVLAFQGLEEIDSLEALVALSAQSHGAETEQSTLFNRKMSWKYSCHIIQATTDFIKRCKEALKRDNKIHDASYATRILSCSSLLFAAEVVNDLAAHCPDRTSWLSLYPLLSESSIGYGIDVMLGAASVPVCGRSQPVAAVGDVLLKLFELFLGSLLSCPELPWYRIFEMVSLLLKKNPPPM